MVTHTTPAKLDFFSCRPAALSRRFQCGYDVAAHAPQSPLPPPHPTCPRMPLTQAHAANTPAARLRLRSPNIFRVDSDAACLRPSSPADAATCAIATHATAACTRDCHHEHHDSLCLPSPRTIRLPPARPPACLPTRIGIWPSLPPAPLSLASRQGPTLCSHVDVAAIAPARARPRFSDPAHVHGPRHPAAQNAILRWHRQQMSENVHVSRGCAGRVVARAESAGDYACGERHKQPGPTIHGSGTGRTSRLYGR